MNSVFRYYCLECILEYSHGKFRNVLSPTNKIRVVELLKSNSASVGRKGRKKAAVLVPMFTPAGKEAPEIIFTVRSSTLTHHRGQVRCSLRHSVLVGIINPAVFLEELWIKETSHWWIQP